MLRVQGLGVILGLYGGYIRDILGLYWGHVGVVLGLYWGCVGIMESEMETTIWGLGFRPVENDNGTDHMANAGSNYAQQRTCVVVEHNMDWWLSYSPKKRNTEMQTP